MDEPTNNKDALQRAVTQSPNQSAITSPSVRKNYLLAIAIDEYQEPHHIRLNNAVRDMNAFADLMVKKFGFEEQNVIRRANEEATRTGIEDAFYDLVHKHQLGSNDNLVIYFSGHGAEDPKLGGSWVPFGATNKWNGYFAHRRIKEYLDPLNIHHVLLIADACHSENIYDYLKNSNKNIHAADEKKSRWALISGRNQVSDGERGSHSPFAQALLDLLDSLDEPDNIESFIDKLKIQVEANTDGKQSPKYLPITLAGGSYDGQFFFHPHRSLLDNLKRENRILREKLNKVEQTYQEQTQAVRKKEQKLDEKEKKIEQLETAKQKIKEELIQAQAQMTGLEAVNDQLNSDKKFLSNELEIKKKESIQIKQEVEDLNGQIQLKQAELDKMNMVLNQTHQDLQLKTNQLGQAIISPPATDVPQKKTWSLFFKVYAGVTTIFLLAILLVAKNYIDVYPELSETDSFSLANEQNTIPGWEKFIKDFPAGQNRTKADRKLNELRQRVANFRNDYELLKISHPEEARQLQDSILKYDPITTQ